MRDDIREPKELLWIWIDLFNEDGDLYFAAVTCTDIYHFIAHNIEMYFMDQFGNQIDVEYDEQLFDDIEERAIIGLNEKKYGKGLDIASGEVD